MLKSEILKRAKKATAYIWSKCPPDSELLVYNARALGLTWMNYGRKFLEVGKLLVDSPPNRGYSLLQRAADETNEFDNQSTYLNKSLDLGQAHGQENALNCRSLSPLLPLSLFLTAAAVGVLSDPHVQRLRSKTGFLNLGILIQHVSDIVTTTL